MLVSMRNSAKLRKQTGIVVLCCTALLYVLNRKWYHSDSNFTPTESAETLYEPEEQMSCKLPVMDPWDPLIQPYLEPNYDGFHCKYVQPYFTYVDKYNYLRRNESEISGYERPTNDPVKCVYQTFERGKTNDDDLIEYNSEHSLLKNIPAPIKTDYVRVNCSLFGRTIYRNVHSLVANRSKSFAKETDSQLSVMLFFMDSTSWSMFQRTLPRFYRFLTVEQQFFVLKGFNKVADNTFPNMIPLLTGKRVFHGDSDMRDEFAVNYKKIQFDNWPLIWYNYTRKGYVTYFDEDTPQFAFFHHLLKGFAKKPTEHSYRPYWLQILRNVDIHDASTFHCFGNTPKYIAQMDIIERVENQYRNKLKFGLTFFNQLSHDVESELSRADNFFTDYFRKWFAQGHFNHSLVILASDHGHRFSPMRATLIGQLEERMPFVSLRFPTWFLRKHPGIAASLEANQNRLTTQFDIYETLADVLNGKYDGQQRNLASRGLTLLHTIPTNRTCKIAGIPQQYCVCSESTPININDSAVIGAAHFLVSHINELLRAHRDICELLHSPTIFHAESFAPNQKVVEGERRYKEDLKLDSFGNYIRLYQITVEVKPSGAQFEALIQHNNISTYYDLVGGDISRINRYENQSDCIDDTILRKYCYCK